MAYRTRKQITVIAIIILFIVAIGAGIYFFSRPSPSCSDGIKNRDEEGIDCGGAYCESCRIKKPIEINWQKAILNDRSLNLYDLAAQIRNPNPNEGLPGLNYVFVLKNSSGSEIGRKQGTTFILPGSEKYIVETGVIAKEDIASIDLQFEQVNESDWKKPEDYQSPQLYVVNKSFRIVSQPDYLAEASGSVKNDTFFDFQEVSVNIILFDANNEVLGASKTMINALKTNEERSFRVTWNNYLGQVDHFNMQVETDLFNEDNYMKKRGDPGVDL